MTKSRGSKRQRKVEQPQWVLVPEAVPPRDPERSAQVRAAMEELDWAKAQALLEPLAAEDESARNNLALTHFEQGDPAYALEVLGPNLSPQAGPQPFARALAVRCLTALGRRDEARRMLAQAADDFGAGLAGGPFRTPPQWREYSVALLLAAGALDDDAEVWAVYQRWLGMHNHPEAHYLGGIAAFNRRRWDAAKKAWLRAPDLWLSADACRRLLPLLASGALQPYRLSYQVPFFTDFLSEKSDSSLLRFVRAGEMDPTDLGEAERHFAEEIAADPHHWSVMLSWVFDATTSLLAQDRRRLTVALVRFGGARGDALAHTVFCSASLPNEFKGAAASGLLLGGRLAEGSEVDMVVDGATRRVRILRAPVPQSDEVKGERS